MGYKNFRTQIVLRILLILISSWAFMYFCEQEGYIVTCIIIALLTVLQIYSLIKYVEQANKRISQFLESIRHSDFTFSFSDPGKGKSYKHLNKAFNDVIHEFVKNRAEKEEHYNYLQTVVQHIGIGILAFRKDGKVDMYNNAVKRLFQLSHIKDIRELVKINADLPSTLLSMESGSNHLFKIYQGSEILQLSIRATEFRMRGEEYLLVSIQNIHLELEEKEIESWQKLIRVLTHEIMNSITPISSLASTVQDMLIDEDGQPIDKEKLDEDAIDSVKLAFSTIKSRSDGLLNFVDTYRSLTRIPKPNFRYFKLTEMFERIDQLLAPKFQEANVHFVKRVIPPDLKLTADPDLLDQVLINLLLNSLDAVMDAEHPKVSLIAATTAQGRTIIEVIDNGYGIKPDLIEKVFIPFFTSKENGSGIGLSLSRQIMHLHRGTISLRSEPGVETVLTLTF